MISFKNWLRKDEIATMSGGAGGGGTFTGDIAKFARPIGGMVARKYPSMDDSSKKKKKPKVLEMFPGKKVVMGDIGYF
jgi:hypothetical protein